MPDAFDRALSVVLGLEGGDTLTDDPNDRGKLTRWGISQAAHPTIDVRNLTRELAAEIYRAQYWDAMHCPEMPPAIALCVFDAAVNQGAVAATKALQTAVGTTPDGVIGARTIAACYRHPAGRVIRRIMAERASRYVKTAGAEHYLRGWLNRVIEITCTAIEWANGQP